MTMSGKRRAAVDHSPRRQANAARVLGTGVRLTWWSHVHAMRVKQIAPDRLRRWRNSPGVQREDRRRPRPRDENGSAWPSTCSCAPRPRRARTVVVVSLRPAALDLEAASCGRGQVDLSPPRAAERFRSRPSAARCRPRAARDVLRRRSSEPPRQSVARIEATLTSGGAESASRYPRRWHGSERKAPSRVMLVDGRFARSIGTVSREPRRRAPTARASPLTASPSTLSVARLAAAGRGRAEAEIWRVAGALARSRRGGSPEPPQARRQL